jgi:MoaA/NifB/PqqE/SkfB family radical SAM enzyme
MVSTVFLELTNHCNMNCDFCSNHLMTRSKGYMSLDLAKSVIRQLNQMNFQGYLITSLMGEPLLHPQFVEILQYSINSGIKTNVITNFLLVPEKISIKKLLNIGIETLCLSYQTPNEVTFKTRRVNKSFDYYWCKLRDIILFSINNKINTSRIEIHILQSMYNHLNVEIVNDYSSIETAILKIYDTLYSDGALPVSKNYGKYDIVNSIKKFKRGNQYQDTFEIEMGPNIYVVLKRANTWANCLLPEDCEVEPQKKGHCGFYNSSLGVLWNGRCTVCCQDFNGSISVGDIKSLSIKDILNDTVLMSMRKMENKGLLIDSYCQICKGTIKRDNKKYSNIKYHGIVNTGFSLANRIKAKLVL